VYREVESLVSEFSSGKCKINGVNAHMRKCTFMGLNSREFMYNSKNKYKKGGKIEGSYSRGWIRYPHI
jgi:hypothetical protein